MSDQHAFELQPPLTLEELAGATVAFGPSGQMLDIKAALEEGDGTIVHSNEHVIATLRQFPALREKSVPRDTEDTPLSVDLPDPEAVERVQFAPQSPTDPALHPGGVPDPLLPPRPEQAAVHAPDPETVEQAIEQPASQRAAERSERKKEREAERQGQTQEGDDDES